MEQLECCCRWCFVFDGRVGVGCDGGWVTLLCICSELIGISIVIEIFEET